MKHQHKIVWKIWSDESRKYLLGKYCEICGKEIRLTKSELLDEVLPLVGDDQRN
jgi:hypothetical protein